MWGDGEAQRGRGLPLTLVEGEERQLRRLAIVTHARIFDPPTLLPQATVQVAAWLESPSVVLLSEGPGYWSQLAGVLD
ncbi:MAG: hypothetical protein LC667_05000, partial [Thioalkalivibrio sp.]|nr:hypothetical protein [Thioalkalivibrio sp.]